MINSFSGEYNFLSNFWYVDVELEGIWFPSVEHAYQAAKSVDLWDWEPFAKEGRGPGMTPGQAKRAGRRLKMRNDWEAHKLYVMRYLLAQKFAPGTELAQKLLDTGNQELVEGNWWGDVFWGVCKGQGRNELGKMLMSQRQWLRNQSLFANNDNGILS